MSEAKKATAVGKVFLTDVRLAFANLFEPKAVAGSDSEPKHSAVFIIEPESANAKKVSEAVKAVAMEKWKDKAASIMPKLIEDNRVCWLKKPKTDKNGETYEGFEGSYSISASNKRRPSLFDRNKEQLVAADGRPYSGCYVNALITIWAQDNQYGRRINAELNGVQFVRDGDAFGAGRVAGKDDFDDLGVDAEASTGSDESLW